MNKFNLQTYNTTIGHSLYIQAKTRYLQLHNMKSILDDKWNLILYLLNLQTDESKVRYLITNEQFNKKIVCNNDLNFTSLMIKKNVSQVVKRDTLPENKYKDQINEALSAIQDIYRGEDSAKPRRQSFIINEYGKALKKIDGRFQNEQDPEKHKRTKVLERMFEEVDAFLRNRENGGPYIDCLEDLLEEAIPNRLGSTKNKPPRESNSPPTLPPVEANQDFIQKNIQT